jgi:thioredoxin-dependent peroxiredoxin
MSKKSRKKTSSKSPATASVDAPKRHAKATARSDLKTSKAVLVKKSSAKAPASRKAASAKPVKTSPGALTLMEGQPAPAFDLPRDGGGSLSLADFAGRNLVLFFYPRANTPGCTREAMDFSRLGKQFAASNTDVVGVSADPLKAQESFRDKHKLTTPLVSDETQEMLKLYGVWGEKSMYGKTFLGIVRTTVLLDGKGKILRIWRNVKVDGHADEVLAVVRSL